jgi:hypothetical protein
MWHPIHDNHAIDVMAALVIFGEQIPELPFKKILKASEDIAFAEGLRSRHSVQQGIEIQLSNGQPTVGPVPLSGRMFNSLEDMSESQPTPARVVEQLQIMPNQVVYRTWRYVSWSWQSNRLKQLMAPALEAATSLVQVAMVRIEYLDRFRFEGDLESANVADVLRRDSDKLAPHIFSRRDLWHSHSGAFLADDGTTRRLEQVHVDELDDPPFGEPRTRWINLMTARENRYPDKSIEQTSAGLFATFDQMHDDLIQLAGSVLTEDIADRIYLKGNKQ